ncbi:TIGR03619 family F420-dependent LLM class oxidoreductase [Nocardioides immobilis]|uniref:TIGR03619 family F420-dependent LLM class oxidoreductase n=1 Tax=Nocardioides immobilis TaxID=2049295 RepID=A0A417XWD6_9ACTN|nr:TIGR03619 family F420-dependent LLM class oxidoreductase [Nocardioides immobilis]RHW24625.1 TIGR03619 family F420-dependent LLM class oxidoreductase [Nocardioides immobilis]
MRWSLSVGMVPPHELPELVRVAEAEGWDAISLPDSVFFPAEVSARYPYTADGRRTWEPETEMPDPLLTIAALAATTTTIRFRTSVLKAPLREPLLLAKQVATLAVLTRDRLELGVGLSWIPEEFTFTGTEMRTRGARLDETIEILRKVCGGGGPRWVEHHGIHHDFDKLMISPAPEVAVPILVGGHADAALRRAARMGDGWISANLPPAELAPMIARLTGLRAEAGRADAPFDVCVAPVGVTEASGFDALDAAGATDVWLSPWRFYGRGRADQASRLDAVRRFAAEVIRR